ncbi:hypothetical protein VE03_10626 [Pseudogymnoascus sp. 23342-1-I1]|nr:hypothetical protein VE03_10626 [Pseudogymnoascus sp. 23342-1-I1]
MKLMSNLEMMTDMESFDSLMRGVILITDSVPIKVMCLGLYPYEQDILPPIATSLSYCPTKKMVQKKDRRATIGKQMIQDEIDYLPNFTAMLRCSYVCAMVGVAFLNVVPVRVKNISRRVRCASYFSDWLRAIIEIHHSFDYKIRIVAMGEFAANTVKKTFGTYRGSFGKPCATVCRSTLAFLQHTT